MRSTLVCGRTCPPIGDCPTIVFCSAPCSVVYSKKLLICKIKFDVINCCVRSTSADHRLKGWQTSAGFHQTRTMFRVAFERPGPAAVGFQRWRISQKRQARTRSPSPQGTQISNLQLHLEERHFIFVGTDRPTGIAAKGCSRRE